MKKIVNAALVAIVGLSAIGCQSVSKPAGSTMSAQAFIEKANADLAKAAQNASHAAWLSSTYINIDSQAVSAKAFQEYNELSVSYAKQAATYDQGAQQPDVARQLERLKLDLVLPAPDDSTAAKALADLGVKMERD